MSLEYFFKKIKHKSNRKIFASLMSLGVILPPRVLGLDITRRCNLNCAHCGAKKETYNNELSTGDIKKALNQAAEYGVQTFSVTGGEPMLRSDLFEIFKYAKDKGLKTVVATNGFFVTPENIKKVSAVIDSIQISLDGPREVHNKIRGNVASYDKVVSAFDLLRDTDLTKAVSSVITPHNLKYLDELYKLVSSLGVRYWKVAVVMQIGNSEDDKSQKLSKDQFMHLMDFIARKRKECKRKLFIELGENSAYCGKYDSMVRSQPFYCPVGFEVMTIGTDGMVRGCPEQPDVPMFQEGDIRKQSLKSIWQNGFNLYRNYEGKKMPACSKCKHFKNCHGGCWVNSYKKQDCVLVDYSLK